MTPTAPRWRVARRPFWVTVRTLPGIGGYAWNVQRRDLLWEVRDPAGHLVATRTHLPAAMDHARHLATAWPTPQAIPRQEPTWM